MKQRILSLLLIVALLPIASSLTACEKGKNKYSAYSFDYFDTATTITGYETSKERFDEVADAILASLGEYHRLFTIYNRYDGLENLTTVNDLVDGEHRVVKVDGRIIDMLLYAKDMYTRTNGRVNIAMGSVLSIWHNYREAGLSEPIDAALPPMEKLTEAAGHTNIDNLIIDEANSTVYLSDSAMRLDVGAIAKGYAVEMVARELEAKGIDGYVINVGGNVRTVGTRGDGQPWVAGVTNPDTDSETAYIAYLNLSGEALVTSGSYQRYYIVNGKSYHHIIDPETLMPAEGYLSVSVLANSSADGDALSTALFCMSLEEGIGLVESLEGVEAFWVLTDGSQHKSSGFDNYIKK